MEDAHHPREFVIPVSYGSTEIIETGKWGFQKPESAFMTAPCQEACPAGNPIPQFLSFASESRYRDALRALLMENPFPGVCGRVCFHPCEANCNRKEFDESVSIHAMERYVFDATSDYTPDLQPGSNAGSGEVAIVGSGPTGLSCAYFLSLLGHRVTLFEAQKELGGVMRWGIPPYRLPKGVLKKEIERITNLGVKVKKGVEVGKETSFEELNRYDAVFLSPGAKKSIPLKIQGEELKEVWTGAEFLERINSGKRVVLGKEAIVIGGGNTAMDVARSVIRLGSKATVVYRRSRVEMPAMQDEIDDAEEEGVNFQFLAQPVEVRLRRDKTVAVKLQRMRLGRQDRSGRPKAVPIEGEHFFLKADGLIIAAGESLDSSWMPRSLVKQGLITAASSLVTSNNKIFAGGDAIDQPRTIVTAIASGKKGALSIDLHLRGASYDEVFPRIGVGQGGSLSMETYLSGRNHGKWPEAKEVVSYDKINTLYFEPSERVKMRRLARRLALKGFSEVSRGFSPEQAVLSASRCFSCGTCNYCYNCYFFCPEGVISLDPENQTKTVDLEHCKGCGTCAKACPRSAVMMKETGL